MPRYDLQKRKENRHSYDVSPDEDKLPSKNTERVYSSKKTVSRTEALQAAKDEEIRLRRQAQILDERLTEARQKAQMRFERQVREAISGQATEVVKALEAARRETERLYALVNRLPTNNLNLRSPEWGRLPMGTRVGGAVNKGRWEKAVNSLERLGAEVPDYETEEYVDPFTDSEQ